MAGEEPRKCMVSRVAGQSAAAHGRARVQGNRRYIKCLYVYNKVDMLSIEEVDQIARRPQSLPVSCYMALNMSMLLDRMWDMMGLVRVFTKKVCHPRAPDCRLRAVTRLGVAST